MKCVDCLSAAIEYAKMGWRVFPCKPGEKVPLTTHGVKDATTDEDVIRKWWTKWPDANVALACGNGIYVVDVDYDKEKGVDGWKSKKEFDEFPSTIVQDTPRGGAHFIFLCKGEPPRNMNNFRNGIDIRGDGYYIMLAPSVHPNGKRYAWADGFAPDEIEAAEFPDFMKPPKKERVMPWASKPAVVAATIVSAASEARTRASAYLARCEPAIQGHGGHSALLWAARSLVEGFAMSESEALSMLWSEYNPRCCPPWNQTDNADRKDFERKVREVARTPSGVQVGHLLEHDDMPIDMESAVRSANALLSEGERKSKSNDDNVPDVVKKIRAKRHVEDEEDQNDPGSTPDAMFSVPGFVSDVVDYTLETAPYPNKALAFAGALALQSFLCSRKVRDEGDVRPNIYLLGLAPSGSGKEWPRKMNKVILHAAGYAGGSIGDRFSSAEGIEDAMMLSKAKLYQTDEIDSMLQSLKSSDPLSANLMGMLLTMYGESSSIHFRRDKSGAAGGDSVANPHLVIYGTAIPVHFYSTLSEKMMTNGLLSRMLVIDAECERKGKRAKIIDPPAKIVDVAKFWQSFCPGGDLAVANPIPITITYTAAANEIAEQFRIECEDSWNSVSSEREVARTVFGRINETALKLAMIYACSENHRNPVIGENAMNWATKFAMHHGKRMLALLWRYGESSEFEKDCQRIIGYIKAAPNGSLSHKVCANRMKMSARNLKERIDTLRDRDMIVQIFIPTGGKQAATYELVKHKK